jgi:Domain of unknown function (DUF5666)
MRKISLVVLSLVLVLGAAGLSLAAETQHMAATTMAKGTVGSVDASGKTFTLKSKAGEETFKVADNATIKEGHKTIGLADLHAGDWVQVSYDTAGSDKQATHVTVLGAATPKNAKNGK